MRIVVTIAMAVAMLLFVLPLVWMVSTSLKTSDRVFEYPPQVVPSDPQWSNYTEVFDRYPLTRWFINSMIVSVTIVIGQLFTSSLAGFAFAKLRFPARDRIFFLYLAGLLVPSQVLIIPIFVIVSELGWVDSHMSLIVPALAGAFGTFLFRQFYVSIPQEYVDAARVDGASNFRIYRSIFLPMSRGLMAAFAAITFLATWNSFLWPLVLLRSPERFTVTLGLASVASQDQFRVPWELVMATAFVTLVPLLVLFGAAQRQFVNGVALSGLGGR